MRFVNVVISNNSRELDRLFCYGVPDGTDICEGMRVLVPFGGGNRTCEAVAVELTDVCKTEKTKNIIKVIDKTPLCTKKLLNLAVWLKKRYLCTYNQALHCVIPSGIRVKTTVYAVLENENYRSTQAKREVVYLLKSAGGKLDINKITQKSALKQLCDDGAVSVYEDIKDKPPEITVKSVHLEIPKKEVYELLPSLGKKAPKQARLLEILVQTGDIPLSYLTDISGTTAAAANALEKKGVISFFSQSVLRSAFNLKKIKKTEPLPPTKEQTEALSVLSKKLESKEFKPVLIRGVTGSGKTEVFLQIITKVIEKGKQAIVLVPEISLTPQTVERFVGRFGSSVSVLHSGLSRGERYDEWRKILSGGISVVVGARSAVFAPLERLGIIIIDEEHENTYKSESVPYYSAAEVAAFRCKEEGAMLVLGSATPSIKSYKKALDGEYDLIEMTARHNSAPMPKVRIVDMCAELKSGNKSVLSTVLKNEIYKNINNGEQTILFLNRRGYNSFVTCRSCGQPVVCKNCSITLTYHKNIDRLQCHCCGFEMPNVKSCPACGSPHIRYMGTGTEKAEQELSALFGENSFLRMDADTTSGKNSHETILKRFRREKIPILLGTQMVTKGLDFENVTLVGVLAADLTLNTDDFRAAERTFSQLTQVCGRAGRGDKPGRAYIQTYQPEHYAVRLASNHDYPGFYKNEIEMRRQLNYPPFCDIIVIMMTGGDEYVLKCELHKIAEYLRSKKLTVLGPTCAPYRMINKKYRWRVIIKTDQTAALMPILEKILNRYSKEKFGVSVDINPNSMN